MCAVFTPKTSATENVIFQDDFESYAVGTFPSSGGWQLVYNGAGDQYQVITNSYSASGSQSLQMEGQYGWSAVVARDFSSSSNLIGFEAHLMGTPGSWPSVGFGNETIQPWGRMYGEVGVDTIDGYITAGSQDLQPCTANTWYKIREVMDRNAQTYNVSVNDVLEGINIPEPNNPWEIQSLRFDVGWNNVLNYYDDVKVFEIGPTPTGAPIISSVTPITATNLQTIYIHGSGFGNIWPQTTPVGDGSVDTVEGNARASSTTPWMDICDSGKFAKTGDSSDGGENWAAGVTDFSTVFCMVGIYLQSWSDTEIVLGGFGSYLGTNGQGAWYIEPGDPLVVDVFTPSGQATYHINVAPAPPPTYSVTINAHCNTEGVDVSVPITMDGSPTGFDTPYTFTVPTGSHTFTVAAFDANYHPFEQWDTGETTTTITVSSAGTHTAYYEAVPYPPTNVVATPLNNAINVSWVNPSTWYWVNQYYIYRSTSPDFVPWNMAPYAAVDGSTFYYIDSVEDNTIYYYQVVANFTQGCSTPSPIVGCARLESVKGICNVVTLNDFQTKDARDGKLPSMFSIQQNFKIPLKYDASGNLIDYYWVQNIIYVDCSYDRSENLMGGGMQVWEDDLGGSGWQSTLVDCYPSYTQPWPPYQKRCLPKMGAFGNIVELVSEIEGNSLVMANNFTSHTFILSNAQSSELYVGLYPSQGFTTGAYRSPEIAIVGYSGDQPNVDFVDPTTGSVDNSFMIGSGSWRQSENVASIRYSEASCLETSTGLKWDTVLGTFEYNDGYTDGNSQEGFWYTPVFGAFHSAPSISPSSSSRALVFSAACPVYLDLYDDQGRCVGYNETSGAVDSQIPNAYWFSNTTLLVINPSGTYNVEVTGTNSGTYELETLWQDVTGTTAIISDLNSMITENETQTYSIGANANVTLTSILPSQTVVDQGDGVQVNATVADLGEPDATFNVTLYANDTVIGAQSMLNVSGWSSMNVCFTWNTMGLALGNYVLWADAEPASGGTGSTYFGGMVQIVATTSGGGGGRMPYMD